MPVQAIKRGQGSGVLRPRRHRFEADLGIIGARAWTLISVMSLLTRTPLASAACFSRSAGSSGTRRVKVFM